MQNVPAKKPNPKKRHKKTCSGGNRNQEPTPKKNGQNGRPAGKKLDGNSQPNSQLNPQLTSRQKPDGRSRGRPPKRSPNHMEREGRDHYDDQDSYHNKSHRRSWSRPRYKEDNYNYYYDKPEDDYC